MIMAIKYEDVIHARSFIITTSKIKGNIFQHWISNLVSTYMIDYIINLRVK